MTVIFQFFHTVLGGKFQEFTVNQILHEIYFTVFRNYKTAFVTILGAVKYANLVNISLLKVQKFRASSGRFSITLISRKI